MGWQLTQQGLEITEEKKRVGNEKMEGPKVDRGDRGLTAWHCTIGTIGNFNFPSGSHVSILNMYPRPLAPLVFPQTSPSFFPWLKARP